jgi:cell wall-associated NlpC family hydrolase
MITLTNLMLLTSVTLFTACSTASPKPGKATPPKLTTLEILGIDAQSNVAHRRHQVATPDISRLPLARTYPVAEPVHRSYSNIPLARTYPVEEYHPVARNYAAPPPVEPTARTYLASYSPEPMARSYPMPYHAEPLRENNYVQNYLTIANQIEADAKSLLGVKYVWGATGPYTYDCSGFTQKVFRDVGINIPRVSRDQARVGQYVSFNNLRRGDMVFFDTHKRRTGKVTHVGIYLGNNNFIHASSAAKKIVIFNFNDKPFYKKRFLWGRRVIRDNIFMASL